MGATVFERHAPNDEVVRAALADSRLTPFWLDDIARPSFPRLDTDADADLVIVGGGFSGLWTAVLAKERDPNRSVILLEARRVAWAASGRNGGFCDASLTHGEENGERRWPDEMPELTRQGLKNLDEYQATVERYGMDVDFERNGYLQVATEPHQVQWLGPDALSAEATRALVNSPTYQGGLLEKGAYALVHPAKMAAELARVATDLGVQIFEFTPVRSLEDGPTLVTDRGRVTARRVALGTNAFPALLKRNRLMTVPVYDYVLVTEPLSAAQMKSIGWEGRFGIGDSSNQFHYYRLTADNRILFGGYDAIYHPGRKVRRAYEDRPESYQKLASHFLTTFPQLEGVTFTHRWAGAIDTCTRFCAFFGTARKGTVAYAVGFTGLGVGATRFGANVMLDLLDGDETERTQLQMVRERPVPFPPEPLAAAGIAATRWSLDRADHNKGKRNLLLKTLDAVGMGFDS
ncbi:MAG: FAD-binding oxidoreductase [Demequina sp.]|nr:FAD-binding oxidoreductase [Demequina sp.]